MPHLLKATFTAKPFLDRIFRLPQRMQDYSESSTDPYENLLSQLRRWRQSLRRLRTHFNRVADLEVSGSSRILERGLRERRLKRIPIVLEEVESQLARDPIINFTKMSLSTSPLERNVSLKQNATQSGAATPIARALLFDSQGRTTKFVAQGYLVLSRLATQLATVEELTTASTVTTYLNGLAFSATEVQMSLAFFLVE